MDSRLSRELWDAFAKAMDRVAYAIGLALKLEVSFKLSWFMMA